VVLRKGQFYFVLLCLARQPISPQVTPISCETESIEAGKLEIERRHCVSMSPKYDQPNINLSTTICSLVMGLTGTGTQSKVRFLLPVQFTSPNRSQKAIDTPEHASRSRSGILHPASLRIGSWVMKNTVTSSSLPIFQDSMTPIKPTRMSSR
jgi:hypothetical protein